MLSYSEINTFIMCFGSCSLSCFRAVVPNVGVAEHFKGGRKAVTNATAKVNVNRTRYRSASSMCFDVCHFSLSYFIRIAL